MALDHHHCQWVIISQVSRHAQYNTYNHYNYMYVCMYVSHSCIAVYVGWWHWFIDSSSDGDDKLTSDVISISLEPSFPSSPLPAFFSISESIARCFCVRLSCITRIRFIFWSASALPAPRDTPIAGLRENGCCSSCGLHMQVPWHTKHGTRVEENFSNKAELIMQCRHTSWFHAHCTSCGKHCS